MWSGAWNKAHFRNLLPNPYLPSSVSRALEWWSRGPGLNPHWGGNFFWQIRFSFLCQCWQDSARIWQYRKTRLFPYKCSVQSCNCHWKVIYLFSNDIQKCDSLIRNVKITTNMSCTNGWPNGTNRFVLLATTNFVVSNRSINILDNLPGLYVWPNGCHLPS